MKTYTHYDKFYKHYGLRKVKDLAYPKIIDTNELSLPRNSVIHYFNQSEDIYPTRELEILSNITNGYILNLFKFNEPTHEFKHINTNEASFSNKYKKLSKDFTTLPTESKLKYKYTRSNNFLYNNTVIYNYSLMCTRYRVIDKIDVNYKLSINILNTIFNNIYDINTLDMKTKEPINHFVIMDLPKVLPSYQEFKILIKRDNTDVKIYQTFFNVYRTFVLELMRTFDKDTYNSTVFKKFTDNDDLKSINIIFKIDNKYTIVNMHTLLGFNSEYPLIDSSAKISGSKYMKLFHFYLKLIYKLDKHSTLDIENGKYVDDINTELYEDDTTVLKVTDVVNDNGKIIDIDGINDEIDNNNDTPDTGEVLINKVLKIEDNVEDVKKVDDVVKHEDVDMLLNSETTTDDELTVELEHNITTNKRKKDMSKHLETLNGKESPYKDGRTMKEMITYDPEDIKIKEEDKLLPDSEVIFNKDLLHDGLKNLTKQYMKTTYKKDMMNVMYSIQKSGMLINDYTIDTYEDVLGKYEYHTVSFKSFNKGMNTIKFKVPVINDDGVFKISNNKYRLKLSKLDLPIDKINSNRVALTTAYSKLFVDKAPYKKIDRGHKIQQALIKKQMMGDVSNMVLIGNNVYDVQFPTDYSEIMRYVSSFNFKDYVFNFDYKNRQSILNNKDVLNKIEKDNILVGVRKGKYILIDKDNNLYEYSNNKYVLIDRLLTVLEIDINSLPHEYAILKIGKVYIPIAYLLCYYLTLDVLLKNLDVTVERYDVGKRVYGDENSLVIKFADKVLKLIFKDKKSKVILGGFDYFNKLNKEFSISDFNKKDSMDGIFKEFGLKLTNVTNIKLLETLYVDPISANILKELKEPVTFVGLLYRSAELLVDDFYHKPNSKDGFLVKGYEKVPQMLYKSLVEAIKDKNNRGTFGDAKLVFDPYSVWRAVTEDSTGMLVDDINPLAYLKQTEEITATGFMGRGRDTMSKSTREVLATDIGTISEAGKDSGDVGVTAYMSADPKISNVRGMKEKDDKPLTVNNVLSTSALLAPFSLHDDPKRLMFAGVMNSHILSMKNASVYPIRTGYESLIAYKLDKTFVAYADMKGVVTKVLKNKVMVTYEDKKKETYTFKDWTSKEESGASWLHKLVTTLKEGDKLEKGDIIYYDGSFFQEDIFNKRRVVYKVYQTVSTALDEKIGSYEDSAVITKEFAIKANIDSVKVRSIILDKFDVLDNIVKVGDELEPNDVLFTIATGLVDSGELSDESMDLLQSFVKNSPKAKVKGTVEKITLYYNCEKETLNKTFIDLISDSEKHLIDNDTNVKHSGKVNSSYSINGVPLDIDKVELKIYIKSTTDMGTGDKGVLGNQLKFTVGEIVNEITTQDNNKKIDVIFSAISLSARIVNSPYLMGTTACVLSAIEDKVVDEYFN